MQSTPKISDIIHSIADGDTEDDVRIVKRQYVPDEFYEENRLMREASKLVPMGEMHQYARPPVHTWELLQKRYPGLCLDQPCTTLDAAKERANAVMKCLRAMGEERCITTVHRF